MNEIPLGDMTLARVIEYEIPLLPSTEVFPDWDPEVIDAHRGWLVPRHYDPDVDRLVITVQSYLIKTTRHTILVDSCIGNDKTRRRELFNNAQTSWLDTLAATGTTPEDVDFVLCTHLHVDHVGWNTRLIDGRWVPTFPNAKYIFAKVEWEHWQREARESGLPRTGNYIDDSVLPVVEAGQVELVETDHSIEDGIWLDPLPGHTPGQVGLHIKSGDSEAVLCGDMMHHMIQCHLPDWSTNFCTDPTHARRTRRAFLERYADTQVLIGPAHFPSPTIGTIESTKEAFRYRYYGE